MIRSRCTGWPATDHLRDAIQYLAEMVPPRERKHPRVLVAATVLTDAAEGRDFVMHARIAVIRALNRNDEREV